MYIFIISFLTSFLNKSQKEKVSGLLTLSILYLCLFRTMTNPHNMAKDTLAKHIVEGLENATSYEGDERNLYLYFEYEKETLCIAFTPER